MKSKADEILEYINSLPPREQEEAQSYVLGKLLGDRLAKGETVEVHHPDTGEILGHIYPPKLPLFNRVQNTVIYQLA